MRIEKFEYDNKVLFRQAFKIREQAFIQELNIDPKFELEHENESTHYLLFDNSNQPIATARWRETEDGIKLERFAVSKKYRSKGIGKIILDFVVKDIIPLKKTIYLNAQIEAIKFYQRNGFEIIGDTFTDAGVIHYKMIYKKA